MHEETNLPLSGWLATVQKYKIHLSVAAAVVVVSLSAFAHYKNEKIEAELVQSIEKYQKNLLLVGGELRYESLECSGLFSTECTIEGIKASLLGQEQFSIRSLRLGNIGELALLKAMGEGKAASASIDIEARQIALPKPMIAQMVSQNVSDTFQHDTVEKLGSIDMLLKGELEWDGTTMKRLFIDRFLIDNAIMPFEFSMEAKGLSPSSPDGMVLERFAFSARNKAISDITYESVKHFYQTLSLQEREAFLKEFGLTQATLEDKNKASEAINETIASHLEHDVESAQGMVEKELLRSMAKMLRGESEEITLEGKNQGELSIQQVQNALLRASLMEEKEAREYMADKFTIDVTSD